MDAAQSKTHIQALINGDCFSVKQLTGVEAISSPFVYEFVLQNPVFIDFSLAVGSRAQLQLKADDGVTRNIAGVVIQVSEQGVMNNGLYQTKIVLASQLMALKQLTDNTVFLDSSLPEICEKLLQSVNIHRSQIQWKVSESRSDVPMLLQLNEDHFSFFQRLLAEQGLFYWSQCEDGREQIVIADSPRHCPYIEREAIALKEQAGLSPAWFYGAFSKRVKHQRQLAKCSVQLHGMPPNPTTALAKSNHDCFELGQGAHHLAMQTTLWAQQAIDCQKSMIEMTTNVEQMSAGYCFSFIDKPTNHDHSGDYFIISAMHQYDETSVDQTGYRCTITAIRREIPYRPLIPKRPQLPLALSARVESNNAYAHVDDQGRYATRFDFDRSNRAHTQASQPLRKLTPYACAGCDQSTGFHFPLLNGDRILVSCINNNPQQAYIVGFVQQDDQPPVVTAENLWQNRIKTAAGNELVMDDNAEAPRIVLQSLNSEHKLELNQTQGEPFVEVLCQFGALSVQSGRNQFIVSGENLTEQVVGSRTVTVHRDHITQTEKALQRQSAASVRLTSQNRMAFNADENSTIKLSGGVSTRTQGKHRLTAGDSFQITASNGSVFLQAQNDICIEGDGRGDMIIENGGGGIKMDAEGNVTLFGKMISFNRDKVTFNGNVNYDIGSPPSPPSVEVEAPDELNEVEAFDLENFAPSSQIKSIEWQSLLVPVTGEAIINLEISNYSPGDSINIDIFQMDATGNETLVESLTHNVITGHGKEDCTWVSKVNTENTETLKPLEKLEVTTPVTLIARVNQGKRILETEQPLKLYCEMTFELKDKEGTPLDWDEATLFHDYDQSITQPVNQGIVTFTEVIVGQYHLALGFHHHKELS